jgi:N-terminal half of MaoC dehydratase
MSHTSVDVQLEPMDTTDVDRWIGRPIAGEQLKEPITVTDIRRWVQGMSYPNRLHYEEDFAAKSEFGRIVAPQSFAVCTIHGHGALPALQGKIVGSHMLFGGDEWWFFGPRIEPGDRLSATRMAFDYRLADTRFAGPTMFQRGDTNYFNQRGEPVAIQRSTAIRFLPENARRLGFMDTQAEDYQWTEEELEAIERERLDYYLTFREHVRKTADQIGAGDLPRRPIGPHTVRSLATEWRSFIFTVWGASRPDHFGDATEDAGWLPEMTPDLEKARIDPAAADGLYAGQAKAHADGAKGGTIGMPKAYGYGASMGAWVLDYVAAWAGEHGFITHSNVQYRSPAFEGDVTFLDGHVTGTRSGRDGRTRADLLVTMTNQRGIVLAKGPVEVRFDR